MSSTRTLILPKPHELQAQVKSEARRFNVLDAGRRWGKNYLLRDRLIEPALYGYPVGWFAPTYRMLSEDWRQFKNVLAPVIEHKLEQEHRIAVIGGGVIDMWSLDSPDVARGRKYKRVAINEAAQVAGLQDAWEQVIRPTLTDFAGDAWFGSTPRGHNFFWKLYMRGQDAAGWPEWRSWKYPTVSNPYIMPDEIEAAHQELPERIFAQEYLADFIEDAGAVFRNLDACHNAPETKAGEHKGHDIFMGSDWGKHNDFTAISVICRTCHAEVQHDRFNQIDYAFQRSRVKALWDRWHPKKYIGESNAMGEPILEQLRRDGVPVVGFETTAVSKPPLIENLALACDRAEYQWLDDAVWKAEMQAYERKVTATGRSSYSAPEGMHDDTVMARALALHAATKAEPTVVF